MTAQTIRKQLISLLEEREMDAKELSKALKIREPEVYDHLAHIQRTLKGQKRKLGVKPFECRVCGFVFENRKQLSKPGRCPKCKQGKIEYASFRIE